MYVKGLLIDWLGFDRDYSRQRLQLPTYPFERSRYWVASNSPLAATSLLPAELTEIETVNSVAMQLAGEENFSEAEAKLLPKIITMLYNRERQNELKFSKIELPEKGIFYSSWKATKKRKTNGEYPLLSRLEKAPEVERLQILISHIQQSVATVLGIDINRAPAPDVGFFNMGMDSLMAVELQKRLEKSLGVSLSSTLAFNYPTIETLGKYLLEEKLLLIREDK